MKKKKKKFQNRHKNLSTKKQLNFIFTRIDDAIPVVSLIKQIHFIPKNKQ